MKLISVITGFTAIAAAFGAGVGFQCWQQRPIDELLQRMPLTFTASASTRSTLLLKLLRTGEHDRAVNILENYLDGDLIGLGPAYHGVSREQREAAWAAEAIEMARVYRAAHPHDASNPLINQAVAATLSIPTQHN
ncbi:MAG: hypothetical protein JWL59_95 [Chthoniobacteraceae bacterium]|nr:hypothetical protein [Chthoniobacteraceae bacterium]